MCAVVKTQILCQCLITHSNGCLLLLKLKFYERIEYTYAADTQPLEVSCITLPVFNTWAALVFLFTLLLIQHISHMTQSLPFLYHSYLRSLVQAKRFVLPSGLPLKQ